MSKGRYFCGGSAVAVTLALAVGAPAFAQDDPLIAFGAADADANGQLSQEEVQTLPEALRDNAVDANGDGVVSLDEFLNGTRNIASSGTTVDEALITGSLIPGAVEDQALAVEVIGRDELENRGRPNTTELVRSLSEIGNIQNQSARGANADGYGVMSINLRNLGSGRTLVALNGRRLADEPVSNGGGLNATGGPNQNANAIPTEVLQQVEILKDGGGTTFGSDAVAGVVNFRTRRDLDGFELSSSYKFVDGSDGDYDANIQYGKVADDGSADILISLFHEHISPMLARDADEFFIGNFYNNQTVNTIGQLDGVLGSYQIQPGSELGAGGRGRFINSISNGSLFFTGNGTNSSNTLYRGAGSQVNNFPSISTSGLLRDDACLELGGYRAYSNTPSPVCSYRYSDLEYIIDEANTWRAFGSANFDITPTLRYHGEALFNKTVTTVREAEWNINAPCDPLPSAAPSNSDGSRDCTRARSNFVNQFAGVNLDSFSVPGYNPAVRDYVLRYYTEGLPTDPDLDDPTATGTQQRVLTSGQIASITGYTGDSTFSGTSTPTGAYLGQGYIPFQSNGNAYGRMLLPIATWDPFIAYDYADAFPNGEYALRNTSWNFRTTQELQGDLGSIFGNLIDFSLAATYSRNVTIREDKGLLTDRLQRALNGFGTDLDRLGPDGSGCTVTETSGSRTVNGATVTDVPYTVGAGGGAGDAALGFEIEDEYAGNGCYFFNPFASGVAVSRLNGQTPQSSLTQVGFVEPGTAYGIDANAGDYQGYAPGLGLQNSPGLVRWLFEQRARNYESDTFYIDLVFNGVVENFQLPGGDIAWATGAQYRYVNRTAFTDRLNDTGVFPCPFMNQLIGDVNQDENIINESSTCSGNDGLFSPDDNDPDDWGTREFVTHAVFAEVNLPLLDNLSSFLKFRYEETKNPNAEFEGAPVWAGGFRYEINDNWAVAASVTQTFDTPVLENPGQVLSGPSIDGSSPFTGIADENINQYTQELIINNLSLLPETGTDYTIRLLFSTRDRRVQANFDYWNNTVTGTPSVANASTIARALTGNRTFGASLNPLSPIDCSNPIVDALFDPANSPAVFAGRPFVQYIDSSGNTYQGCRTGTTLSGLDQDGPGVDDPDTTDLDESLLATGDGDWGLFITAPSRINAGNLKRSGIDMGVDYTPARQFFGGQVSLSADVSWALTVNSSDALLFGIPITEGSDDIGTLNTGFTTQANIWRGSVGAVYQRGRHLVNLRASYIGSYADLFGAARFGAAFTPANNANNINPTDQRLCSYQGGDPTTLGGFGIPFLPTDSLVPGSLEANVGPFYQGDNGAFNGDCILTNRDGIKVDPTFVVNGTYRVALPYETTLTVTVDNILGADPGYVQFTYNYNPFGSIGPQGRTIKVGVSKRFN